MSARVPLALGLAALVVLSSTIASAQAGSVLFHGEVAAGFVLQNADRGRFGAGAYTGLRVGYAVTDNVSVQLGTGNAWFLADEGDPGRLYTLGGGARFYLPVSDRVIGGPWLDANLALGVTGSLERFVVDAGVGWAFRPAHWISVGPVVRYHYILQPNSQPRPDDGHVLEGGINLTFHALARPDDEPPASDDDGDRVFDPEDRCPDAPEDHDGFQDEDGCPDPDNDSDGFLDADDRCPLRAETRNGHEDDDGCPDVSPPPASEPEPPADLASPAPVYLEEQVMFRVGSPRVSPRFRELIHGVCAQLSADPNLRVRVVGHADERGSQGVNQELAARRAGAVARLVVRLCEVAPERVESAGYGATQPMCADESRECLEQNRRVMFQVLRRR